MFVLVALVALRRRWRIGAGVEGGSRGVAEERTPTGGQISSARNVFIELLISLPEIENATDNISTKGTAGIRQHGYFDIYFTFVCIHEVRIIEATCGFFCPNVNIFSSRPCLFPG